MDFSNFHFQTFFRSIKYEAVMVASCTIKVQKSIGISLLIYLIKHIIIFIFIWTRTPFTLHSSMSDNIWLSTSDTVIPQHIITEVLKREKDESTNGIRENIYCTC